MNILFDINHPAHVHLFRNSIKELEKKHNVLVIAINKDIVKELLDEYEINYLKLYKYPKNTISKIFFTFYKIINIIFFIIFYKIDLLIGVSFFNCISGWLTRKNTWMFDDTEHAKNYIYYKLFATKIFTPDSFLIDLGPKQVRYPGYHELAYLHPNRFIPNPEVLNEIGLTEQDKFFIVRFVSWEATHDIGQKGLSIENKRKLIETLKPYGKIIISSERELPEEFEEYRMTICPTKMHDLLYYASLYIGESGTMASESCVLGTQSIFINVSFLDKNLPGVLQDQKKYGLYIVNNIYEIYVIIENQLKLNFQKKNDDQRLFYINKIKSEKIDTTKFILNMI